MIFRFGEFELDELAYELRSGGTRVRLARQPMDLLFLLVRRPGELVTREEIAKQLWGSDVFVDCDAGIHTAVLKIRQALGNGSEASVHLETVPGKGYRLVGSVEAGASSRRAPLAPHPTLPETLTTFIGRERELTELPVLLAGGRLLTLTGPAGIGKTRLAIRLARAVRDTFPDGVWFVDLAPLSSTELVIPTIANALGMRPSVSRSSSDVLADGLRQRIALIVFDNCEHLIDACASIAGVLLQGAPALRIVATSRESLGLPGEVVYRVRSLSVTDALPHLEEGSDAIRLFGERARTVDAGFVVDAANVATIARICRSLDGIPLAIELAAARVRMLTLQQIESRLSDRFQLLTGGARTVTPRQRTLEAAIEWSHQLLSESERLLLTRVSVFPASWTLDAAERLCAGDSIRRADILDLLTRLADKSLLSADSDFDDQRRYRLLESVRQFARQKLVEGGSADRWAERHFQCVLDEFRGAQKTLRGPGQVALLKRLCLEQENVRSALEWGLNCPARAADASELAGALFWFWTKRGLFEEGERWLNRAADVPAPAWVRARTLIGLAHMQDFQGRHGESFATATQALELARAANHPWAVSAALFMRSLATFQLGTHDVARRCAIEARDVAVAGCDVVEQGGPLMILANLALTAGDLTGAEQLFDESIDVHRRGGEPWGLAILLSIAAGLRILRDDLDTAAAHASEALTLSEILEDPRGVAWSLEVVAGVLAAQHRSEAAARVWGVSDALLESAGGAVLPSIGWIRDRYVQPVAEQLGPEEFVATRAAGRGMTTVQAIALLGGSQ